MPSEIQSRAGFTEVRYAQVWEDADVLLEGLAIQPGDVCLSITSAGDNALAMLALNPSRVVAVDLSPAQIACLELRVAAYQALSHRELLVLVGSRPEEMLGQRHHLFRRCEPMLCERTRNFWKAREGDIPEGIGALGKFEHYFQYFRNFIVPLIHTQNAVEELFRDKGRALREAFYRERWDTWRWRLLFRIFFSRVVMGRLGRDPTFFRYVEGSVSKRILERARHAFVELNPAENPYLQWIFTGAHRQALPFALRPENFETIRENLPRLEWRQAALEDVLEELGEASVDRFNLSDIFEYMDPGAYHALLDKLLRTARKGGRLAYWNMLTPRRRPESMAERLKPLDDLARELWQKDKAFFYSAFILEEVR